MRTYDRADGVRYVKAGMRFGVWGESGVGGEKGESTLSSRLRWFAGTPLKKQTEPLRKKKKSIIRTRLTHYRGCLGQGSRT